LRNNNKPVYILKMKNIILFVIFLCVKLGIYAQNCNNVKIKDTTEFEIKEGGYILPPSDLFGEVKPEANWIWDSGEINPTNYFLHVRKSFYIA